MDRLRKEYVDEEVKKIGEDVESNLLFTYLETSGIFICSPKFCVGGLAYLFSLREIDKHIEAIKNFTRGKQRAGVVSSTELITYLEDLEKDVEMEREYLRIKLERNSIEI